MQDRLHQRAVLLLRQCRSYFTGLPHRDGYSDYAKGYTPAPDHCQVNNTYIPSLYQPGFLNLPLFVIGRHCNIMV